MLMTIDCHWESFAGYQVRTWIPSEPLTDLEHTAYRINIGYGYKQTWHEKFLQYLAQPLAEQTRGLVLGQYAADMYDKTCLDVVNAVLAAKEQLPLLDMLFLNDITYDEYEISWIQNTDNAPLLHAFPALKHFGSRGGNGLRLKQLDAPALETLVIQSGGLSAELIRDVASAHLPNLKHLELYLGTQEYGYGGSIEDLQPILQNRFNQLTYLGLKNCDDQDSIVQAVFDSPVINHLQTLDLSLGTLTDEGAQYILGAPSLGSIRHLDLSFHYLSDEMVTRLEQYATQRGITIDLTDQQEADADEDDEGEVEYYRYVSIGE